jgi:3-hydroxyisobutyrate dehydrogenase-like beta-hydroxyacid dehydrogenase
LSFLSEDLETKQKQFKVGFFGCGKMGEQMAKHLLKPGCPITAYDVRKDPVDQLSKLGAGVLVHQEKLAQKAI